MKMKFEVLSWDYTDSPPWTRINELIQEYPACHIIEVQNTHDGSNAVIVSDGILQAKDVQTIYDTTKFLLNTNPSKIVKINLRSTEKITTG